MVRYRRKIKFFAAFLGCICQKKKEPVNYRSDIINLSLLPMTLIAFSTSLRAKLFLTEQCQSYCVGSSPVLHAWRDPVPSMCF